MNGVPLGSRLMRLVISLGVSVAALAAGHSATESRVEVIRVPGASNVMKAETGPDGAIHVLYDAEDGPRYVTSLDSGRSFSAPMAVVDQASRQPGLQFITWDLVVDRTGRDRKSVV